MSLTPRNEDIGDLSFDEAFGKNNGAVNSTPERPPVMRLQRPPINKNSSQPPVSFSQWSSMIGSDTKLMNSSTKTGGKTRKRKTHKTRSRKHKKSHKKSHKKAHKKTHKKTNRKGKKSRK